MEALKRRQLAGDPELFVLKRAVLGFPSLREGAALTFFVLWKICGFERRSAVRIHKATLAEWLLTTTRSIDRYIKALDAVGLVDRRDCDRGLFLLDVNDPDEVLASIDAPRRAHHGALQLPLAFDDDDEPQLDDATFDRAVAKVATIKIKPADRSTEPPVRLADEPADASNDSPTGGSVGGSVAAAGVEVAKVTRDECRELTTARTAIGSERFDLWFAGCRIQRIGDRLEIVVGSDFLRTRLTSRPMRDDVIALQTAFGVERSVVVVDEALAPTEDRSADRTAESRPLHTTPVVEKPVRGFSTTTQHNTAREDRSADGSAGRPEKIEAFARSLLETIDDPTLDRWFVLVAAIRAARREIPVDELRRLAAECGESGTWFNTELPKLFKRHRVRWLRKNQVRRLVESESIAWSTFWQSSPARRRPK